MNDIDKMPVKCRDCPYWELATFPWCCGDCVDKMNPKNSEYIKRIDAKRALMALPADLDAETVQRCVEAMNNPKAADVEPKHRWIPTTEDVPHIKEGCAGAVVVNAVYWAIGKYISMPLRYVRKKIRNKLVERWEYMDGSIVHKSVLYWMPLPEPPKENPNDK